MKVFGLRGALLGVAATCAFAAVSYGQAPTGVIESSGGGGAWSSASTWVRTSGTGALPAAGDEVRITMGSPVTLDTNAGIRNLAKLTVEDALTVADTQTYSLGVARVEVHPTGSFIVGTASQRFTNAFTLTLTDAWLSDDYESPDENRTLHVHGGTIEMHGDDSAAGGGKQTSWLRLEDGANAAAGSTTLTLEAAPGWQVGDRIVIASTDFDHLQAEWRTITAITGNVLTLNQSLTKNHHGTIESGIVDERAEVGLLSKNVRIVGPSAASSQQRGGHCMFMLGGGTVPTVRLDWIELHEMGWFGAKGRYPIHIHEIGTAPGTYVRGVSIWKSYNRAVAVHNTNEVEIADTVAYDVIGHMYYLEAGPEVDNVLARNLGLVTRVPMPSGSFGLGDTWYPGGPVPSPFFTASDAEVSTYWIPNTDNTLEDNVAAGSQVHGFWYDLPPGSPLVIQPRFDRNVAHSNGQNGFHNETSRYVAFDPSQLSQPPTLQEIVASLSVAAEFRDFTAYKNRNSGIWNRCYGWTRFLRAKVADNQIGVYFASEGFQLDHLVFDGSPTPAIVFPYFTGAPQFSVQTLEDSDVLGETGNTGNPTAAVELAWLSGARSLPDPAQPQFELKGIELYDGLMILNEVRFRDFTDQQLPAPVGGFTNGVWSAAGYTHRPGIAVGAKGQHSAGLHENGYALDPRNCIAACTFTNVSHAVLFPKPHPAYPCDWLGLQNKPAGANACFGAGLASTALLDLDGCLPGSQPNTYWLNNTPLVRPTGSPAPTPVPNLTDYDAPLELWTGASGHDLVQFQMAIDSDCTTGLNQAITSVTFSPTARPSQALEVFDFLGSACPGPGTKGFAVTLLTNDETLAGTSEEYVLTYTAGHVAANDPRDILFSLQFSEPNRHVLLGIPYGGLHQGSPKAPRFVRFSAPAYPNVPPILGTDVGSKALVLSGNGADFHWDPNTHVLWIRPTLVGWYVATLFPQLAGRGIVCEIIG